MIPLRFLKWTRIGGQIFQVFGKSRKINDRCFLWQIDLKAKVEIVYSFFRSDICSCIVV